MAANDLGAKLSFDGPSCGKRLVRCAEVLGHGRARVILPEVFRGSVLKSDVSAVANECSCGISQSLFHPTILVECIGEVVGRPAYNPHGGLILKRIDNLLFLGGVGECLTTSLHAGFQTASRAVCLYQD